MTLRDTSADELAAQLAISPRAVEEAIRRELLGFVKHRNFRCWRFGDSRNASIRRMDGKQFRIGGQSVKAVAETRGEAWHYLIGIDEVASNNRGEILLTPEGSKDALAALHFAAAEGALSTVGVVAALGTCVNPCQDDIEKFHGRRVRIFGDADEPGKDAASRIAQQLLRIAMEVQIVDLTGLKRNDGGPVKDLFDLTRVDADDFENNRDLWDVTNLNSRGPRVRVVTRRTNFFPLLLSSNTASNHDYYGTVTKDNQRNTNDHQGLKAGEKEEICIELLLEIAESLACREKGKGHLLQFQLARQIRRFETEHKRLSCYELRSIHCRWFSASTALPSELTEPDSFGDFIDRLRKVRIIPGTTGNTLQLARERALAFPLPDIPGFIDAPLSMRKIAALHRELQRAANSAPHFCTAETAREFAGLEHKSEAHRIQVRLTDDRLGVLKCVKRGEPHRGGRPNQWFYLLPIPSR